MGLETKLSLKQTQKLVMTAMLQQAIKLLPMARLELVQVIQQELTDNPMLEEVELAADGYTPADADESTDADAQGDGGGQAASTQVTGDDGDGEEPQQPPK